MPNCEPFDYAIKELIRKRMIDSAKIISDELCKEFETRLLKELARISSSSSLEVFRTISMHSTAQELTIKIQLPKEK